MTATLYLLDPETTIFRPVTVPTDDGWGPIYSLIGCSFMETIRFDDRHFLFADEEGLTDGLTSFTIFEPWPRPLAGKIVLAAESREGSFAAPVISLADAATQFQLCRPVLDPVFSSTDAQTSEGYIHIGGLRGFQTRIERRAPTLAQGEA